MALFLFGVIYRFAECISGRAIGLLALLLVAALNEVQTYTTSFMFAIPTTLFFVSTIYCYSHSKNFTNQWWSSLLGLSLALMVLSRTMAIAFLPAFVLVGGFYFFMIDHNG